jgi:hypothetical protein
MAYYPKSRIVFFNSNNEFITEDGKLYQGPCYKLFDGRIFAGNDPSNTNILLKKSIQNNKMDFLLKDIKSLQEPIPYKIELNEDDIRKGFIFRYLAKNKTKIININKEIYEDILSKRGKYNYINWEVISFTWKISGNKEDEFINGIIKKGTRTINKNTIDRIKNKFIGIEQFILDYSEFGI